MCIRDRITSDDKKFNPSCKILMSSLFFQSNLLEKFRNLIMSLFKKHIWKLWDYLWDSSMNKMSLNYLQWDYEWILIRIETTFIIPKYLSLCPCPVNSCQFMSISCPCAESFDLKSLFTTKCIFQIKIESNMEMFRVSFLLRKTFWYVSDFIF